MAKITSKYQVTVPKAIADRYNMRPGDDIAWVPAGDSIRVIPENIQDTKHDKESRLRLFDQATERNHKRSTVAEPKRPADRGWTREDLYERGRSRRYEQPRKPL
jgi:AbrB family looped-hinge helix DNA binding protein